MKRLVILTIIAVTTVALSGCCRSRSLFSWNQGGCNTCGTSYSSVPSGTTVYEGGLLPPPTVMPGPAPQQTGS